MAGKRLEELPIPKHTGSWGPRAIQLHSQPLGKLATFTLGHLTKVRLHEKIPRELGQSGVSSDIYYPAGLMPLYKRN